MNNDNLELSRALIKTLRAYKRLAQENERSSTRALNSSVRFQNLISTLGSQIEDEISIDSLVPELVESRFSKKEITVRAKNDSVRIGIASMPGREDGLNTVLRQLAPQADEIFVYLNAVNEVNATLPEYRNVRYFTGPDLGDRGKFHFMENFEGYYLTCDDDIVYPNNYVQSIINGIEKYSRQAVVGWHGSIFKENFKKFYDAKYRQVLSFSKLRGTDTFVHILGTGICGFHTSTISLSTEDFRLPNMADVYLGIQCQLQSIPMVVLAHEGGLATPIDTPAAISTVSMGKANQKNLDVSEVVTRLVQHHEPWKIRQVQPLQRPGRLKIAFIGRTDKERWKKGGILKSAHLTKDMLMAAGHEVRLFDIETSDLAQVKNDMPDCVIIYVGDPERPDFARVEALIESYGASNIPVLINLSLNLMSRRTDLIVSKMKYYESKFGSSISLMVFTSLAKQISEFSAIRHLITVFPKSLESHRPAQTPFSERKGIFIGDIGKLSNPSLISGDVHDWIRAIREAVPDEPIIAVQQYKPAKQINLDVDEIWPFMVDEYEDRLSTVKLMISPIKYATFEMVPVEVSSLGAPVIHTAMPQSLSETFGGSSIEVSGPEDLPALLPMICNEELLWNGLSAAGRESVSAKRLHRMYPVMDMQIRAFVDRAQRSELK